MDGCGCGVGAANAVHVRVCAWGWLTLPYSMNLFARVHMSTWRRRLSLFASLRVLNRAFLFSLKATNLSPSPTSNRSQSDAGKVAVHAVRVLTQLCELSNRRDAPTVSMAIYFDRHNKCVVFFRLLVSPLPALSSLLAVAPCRFSSCCLLCAYLYGERTA